MIARCLLLALAQLLVASQAFAQAGDRQGEEQPPPPKEWVIPKAPPLSPEEALRAFVVEPGMRVELVACEPLVEDPVAIRFDGLGRLWVIEMRSYMPNVAGEGEREPIGQLAVLKDTDGDGRMDERITWLDDVALPRALALLDSGVLLLEPPTLRHFADRDGDLEPDWNGIAASGFGGLFNVEHAPNGLLWGLDNWLHFANHPGSLRSVDGQWTQRPTHGGGQWGLSQDDSGRLYFNSNSDQLRCDLIPPHYAVRNPHLGVAAGTSHRVTSDQRTWPVRITPGVNRGYQKNVLTKDGYLSQFTAACAPHIYRGSALGPEHRGNAFVCEPSGNLIKRNILTEDDHRVSAKFAYEGREFLASKDERFRPVNLSDGPDGALYVVDLYRGILQHRMFVTTYLKRQILERGLDKPLGLGRIWRVRPDTKEPLPTVLPANARETELIQLLGHENGWVRDTAQQRMIQHKASASREELASLLLSETAPPIARIHALWTLEGRGEADDASLLQRALEGPPELMLHALRVAEPLLGHAPALLKATTNALKHPSFRIRWQATLSLSTLNSKVSLETLACALAESPESPELRDAALSGMAGRELEFLQTLIFPDPARLKNRKGVESLLRTLARCVTKEAFGPRIRELLHIAAALGVQHPTFTEALLAGIIDAHPARGGKAPPLRLDAEPEFREALAFVTHPGVQARMATLDTFWTWPGEARYEERRLRPLTRAERALFEQGRTYYTITCAGCHQANGLGMPGLAPRFAGSEWVLGDPSIPIRIVEHGLSGPINIADERWDQDMPAVTGLSDDQLAGILTYIRRAFGNEGEPVTPEQVAAVRAEHRSRGRPWTAAELEKR
jgi:mono/diheme cytochrome c family protein/glucose/arabinose dehydrogenase